MRYAFPCNIVLDEEEERATGREAYNVTFPDIPEAITCGWSWEEALEMAEDCLGVALSFYVDRREDIPSPSPVADVQVLIPVPLIVAAKLTLYTAMRRQGITNVALAARLGVAGERRSQAPQPESPLPYQPGREGPQGRGELAGCGRHDSRRRAERHAYRLSSSRRT